MIKNIVIGVLLLYTVFGASVFDILDTPTPTPTPAPLPMVEVDEPSEEVKKVVSPIADVITDTNDRVEVALYFLELSKRIENYKQVSLQQLNDLVVHSASTVFDGRLHGKYDVFDEQLVVSIQDIAGNIEHKLEDGEKTSLHDLFEGIAWSLVQVKKG